MRIEIDVPDDRIEATMRAAITNAWNWSNAVGKLAEDAAREKIKTIAMDAIVSKYIDERLPRILEDVVYKQVRHVVKLAVDRELAVAREAISVHLNRRPVDTTAAPAPLPGDERP